MLLVSNDEELVIVKQLALNMARWVWLGEHSSTIIIVSQYTLYSTHTHTITNNNDKVYVCINVYICTCTCNLMTFIIISSREREREREGGRAIE